jgi:cytochrome c peroxidase
MRRCFGNIHSDDVAMAKLSSQEEFNFTDDRKVAAPSMGVSCLDCHSNFHTNAAFHLTPDLRPQTARFRLDTTSLRGLFNQQIHGSKRSLRSVEDFTEFEQRTAYFNGDHASATRKGVNLPDRPNQVAMMAQMQNIIDFPPAPKLDIWGKLDPKKASAQELAGERVFMGKGRCMECHVPQTSFLDNNMHDLKLERFYRVGQITNDLVAPRRSHQDHDIARDQGLPAVPARRAPADTRGYR